MCFSMSAPKPPPIPPAPNKFDDNNQAAVQNAMRRVKGQNAFAQTTLTGGLGDPGYGQNIQRATLLGATT